MVWMSHVTHTCEWVMSHTHVNESCHTHMWMSHVTHTCEWVMWYTHQVQAIVVAQYTQSWVTAPIYTSTHPLPPALLPLSQKSSSHTLARTHTYMHTHTHTDTHTHTYTHTPTHTHSHTLPLSHTHIRTHKHTHTHTHKHTNTPTNTHTHTHTHICVQTHMHIHTHTHTQSHTNAGAIRTDELATLVHPRPVWSAGCRSRLIHCAALYFSLLFFRIGFRMYGLRVVA